MAAWPGSLSYVNSVDDILRIPRPRVLDTAKGLVDRLAAVVLGATHISALEFVDLEDLQAHAIDVASGDR